MPKASSDACVIALSESRALAAQVAGHAGVALAPIEERRFEGGEFKLRPLESVRGRIVFVLQSLAGTSDAPVADRLLRLLLLLQGLRDAGAERLVAVVPYLAFARKDRRTQMRDPVTSRYIAELMEATGLHRLVALDVHNGAAFDNAFRVPTDHLTALPMMVDHFARQLDRADIAVASPDVGGIKRAQVFRELLAARLGREVPMAFIEKRRALDVVTGGTLVGEVSGRSVIVLDDLCATGGTLVRAAAACRQARAAAVHVAVTHAPIPTGVRTLIDAEDISSAVVTDSVAAPLEPGGARGGASGASTTKADPGGTAAAAPAGPSRDKLVVLPIAPLFGEAIRRMLSGRPVAPLLERWPPGAD
jgi:ribose-phosphate pyrophosphokinase